MRVSDKRWQAAQHKEKTFWLQDNINRESMFRTDCDFIYKTIKRYRPDAAINNTLQIGSGYQDVIDFWPEGNRYAIDPLMNFYDKHFALTTDVKRYATQAEHLSFEKNYFDVALLRNVLDHTQHPHAVVAETYRVLKPGGICFFEVNVFNRLEQILRGALELFWIDTKHPHTFNQSTVQRLFDKTGFTTQQSLLLQSKLPQFQGYQLKTYRIIAIK